MLIPQIIDLKEVEILAERVVRAIAQLSFIFSDRPLRVTVSPGIALYPQHGATIGDLVAHADTAMYQAKACGKKYLAGLPPRAGHDNQLFVKSIADVARGMGKVTVAEFVEDEATLDLLTQFGVDLVQGYFLDRPVADYPASCKAILSSHCTPALVYKTAAKLLAPQIGVVAAEILWGSRSLRLL